MRPGTQNRPPVGTLSIEAMIPKEKSGRQRDSFGSSGLPRVFLPQARPNLGCEFLASSASQALELAMCCVTSPRAEL